MVLDEYKYFVDDMNDLWKEMSAVIAEFPEFFPKDQINRDVFFWAYEFVMTRVFGWSLPSTSLIPFADMLNHGIYAATHYVIHKKMEVDTEKRHPQYVVKNQKINLQLLKIQDLQIDPSKYISKDKKKEFLIKHIDIIEKLTNKKTSISALNALGSEQVN